MCLNIAGIKFPDVGNGDGCRLSIFVSGCTLNCPDCFNQESQDFNYGTPLTENMLLQYFKKMDNPWVSGMSLLGGDPLEPHNQIGVLKICQEFKQKFPDKNIYLWTGRTLNELYNEECKQYETAREILKYVDVLIDGRFMKELKEPNLYLRGSTNQQVYFKKKGCYGSKKEQWEVRTN